MISILDDERAGKWQLRMQELMQSIE